MKFYVTSDYNETQCLLMDKEGGKFFDVKSWNSIYTTVGSK